jgi:hypothetical protein
MASWESVLEEVVAVASPSLECAETRWAVLGSVATALQGCSVTPRDIDILAVEPAGVFRFVELMAAYTPARCENLKSHDDWHSSQAEPVSEGPDDYGFYWYFTRWVIDGVKVEVAHIVGPEGQKTSEEGAGIWEAGPEIWPHIHKVPFREYQVPVVPLEIQLETSLQRGLDQRVAEIQSVLRREGYDEALVKRALSAGHREMLEKLLPP